ncbi:glycosyl transferase [Halovivax ruber XH-70]|uniref:Glycosyl transferase n=1 Tax=Halovivax ruber (strain DSM 18193 / JCM 13892 / XH-70) TaxID=797302 RepID=L0IF23_HALRX|nr:glycosyltransferase family 2 protein [Halovivax ruber]AGB17438.1 glycosyl transferase [Halovivax ruber XH-70]
MYRDHSVGVVMPAYNEEGFVGDVICDLPEFVDRVYVIDDCSTDGTWDEIREAASRDAAADDEPVAETALLADGGDSALSERATIGDPVGRVIPIRHRENRGAGGAIKTGYLAAVGDDMDVTVTVDADGQMDLEQMPRLIDPIVDGEAEYAKGNRLLYREFRQDMPRFRFLGNSILTFLTKIASGYWKTMDPQNGYTAISGYALANVGVESMYEYYGYCNDLLVKLNAKGMRVADVAIPAIYGDEASSISYPTYIRRVSWMLFKNFCWRLKVKYLVLDFHPLALFYVFGTATAALGVLGGLWSLYVKYANGDPLFVRASLSLLLFLIGSLFLMFAMLFDMQVNEQKEVQIRE